MNALQRYFCSRFLTTIAYQIQTVALGWQAYSLRGNAMDLGWVGLAQFLPMFLFSLVGGQVADRYERKKILLTVHLLWMLSVLGLSYATFESKITLPFLLCILVLQGTIRAFSNPATQAFITQIVPPSDFNRAIALSSSIWQLSTILGPLVGGALYAVVKSADWVYLVCALCSLLGWVVLGTVKARSTEVTTVPFSLQTLFDGVKYVRSKPLILGAISLDLFAVLFGGATALLPVYASDILKVGPEGLGALRAAPAVGAILMSLWLARVPVKKRVGFWLFFNVIIFGLSTIGFGLSKIFWLSWIMLFITGASDIISVVIRMTLVQIQTPSSMRGQVSAVNSIFISASNELGEFESGITAGWFGVVPAVVIGGTGSVVVALLWSRWFPELRKMNRIE